MGCHTKALGPLTLRAEYVLRVHVRCRHAAAAAIAQALGDAKVADAPDAPVITCVLSLPWHGQQRGGGGMHTRGRAARWRS